MLKQHISKQLKSTNYNKEEDSRCSNQKKSHLDKLKAKYLRAIILKHEITEHHKKLNDEHDFMKKMILFKNCFITLDILRDSFSYFSEIQDGNNKLTEKSRSLRKRLRFTNHIRNKISGHLEEKLLEKAIQWEPLIFRAETKDNKDFQIFLSYKTLIESAINSYLDDNSKQKVFNNEIDLFYQPNRTLFYNYIGKINEDSISFLNEITLILENKIDFWTDENMHEMAKKAGETNFNLKNN